MKTLKKRKNTGKITKKEPQMRTVNYKDLLIKDLKNLDYAAGYLTAALAESESAFLLAVKDIAIAHGGISNLSKETKLNRENLYFMLSKNGNPRLSSISCILDKLGIHLTFSRKAA